MVHLVKLQSIIVLFFLANGLSGQNMQDTPITATEFINEHPSKKEQFYKNWNKGVIRFVDGQVARNCILRYHSWKDDLLWIREPDFKTGVVIKESIASFEIETEEGGSLRFVQYNDTSSILNRSIFLEVLAEGKLSFYCYRKVNYVKSSDIFIEKYQYYLQKDGIMNQVRLKKGAILSLFSDTEKKELKQLMQNNRWKFINEHQLASGLQKFSER